MTMPPIHRLESIARSRRWPAVGGTIRSLIGSWKNSSRSIGPCGAGVLLDTTVPSAECILRLPGVEVHYPDHGTSDVYARLFLYLRRARRTFFEAATSGQAVAERTLLLVEQGAPPQPLPFVHHQRNALGSRHIAQRISLHQQQVSLVTLRYKSDAPLRM